MNYKIQITPHALGMLKRISDQRVRAKIIERIDSLTVEPEQQGKALTGPLREYRSIRAASQSYRIIYKVERNIVVVNIVAIGIRKEKDRKDIYYLAQKLLKAKLL